MITAGMVKRIVGFGAATPSIQYNKVQDVEIQIQFSIY